MTQQFKLSLTHCTFINKITKSGGKSHRETNSPLSHVDTESKGVTFSGRGKMEAMGGQKSGWWTVAVTEERLVKGHKSSVRRKRLNKSSVSW